MASYAQAAVEVEVQTGRRVSAKTQQRLEERQIFDPPAIEVSVEQMSLDGGMIRLRTPPGEATEWREYKALNLGELHQGMAWFKDNEYLLEWANGLPLAPMVDYLGDGHDGIWGIYAQIGSDGQLSVFNVGGDLELFAELIRNQDFPALLRYGQSCVKVLYKNYCAYNLPITTISLGRVDISSEPNVDCPQVGKTQVISQEFVITSKNSSESLDFIEKAFYKMAFTIAMLVILASLLAVFARGNDNFDVPLLQPFNKGIGIVGFIGKNRFDRIAVDQRYGLRDIVSFTPRHPKFQRIA